MKILNYGSLNIDHVYNVDAIVKPGQTIDSFSVSRHPGGKGMNQSVALARAGASVYHAGMIGSDGLFLKELLLKDGVDCRFLKTVDGNTGSAFIQVDKNGQNCIVLNGGTNRMNTREYCDEVLSFFEEDDILLLQNEINEIDYLIDRAYEKKMYIVLNPSPMNENVLKCNLHKVSLFLMNEDEAARISGKSEPEEVLNAMKAAYPDSEVVMTLGAQGSVYQGKGTFVKQEAFRVKAVDTTAAGDTYTGFLLASLADGKSIQDCLALASKASAISVTKEGAASSIPYMKDITID